MSDSLSMNFLCTKATMHYNAGISWFAPGFNTYQFKVDRLQIIVVAKNITVLQLFISRMPKMCATPQLVSAPLNPLPTVEHFRRSHPQFEHSYI